MYLEIKIVNTLNSIGGVVIERDYKENFGGSSYRNIFVYENIVVNQCTFMHANFTLITSKIVYL